MLSPVEGVVGSDYINATRVDVSDRLLFHRIALYFFITFLIVLVFLVTSCTLMIGADFVRDFSSVVFCLLKPGWDQVQTLIPLIFFVVVVL